VSKSKPELLKLNGRSAVTTMNVGTAGHKNDTPDRQGFATPVHLRLRQHRLYFVLEFPGPHAMDHARGPSSWQGQWSRPGPASERTLRHHVPANKWAEGEGKHLSLISILNLDERKSVIWIPRKNHNKCWRPLSRNEAAKIWGSETARLG
jgi:hypothetical protein